MMKTVIGYGVHFFWVTFLSGTISEAASSASAGLSPVCCSVGGNINRSFLSALTNTHPLYQLFRKHTKLQNTYVDLKRSLCHQQGTKIDSKFKNNLKHLELKLPRGGEEAEASSRNASGTNVWCQFLFCLLMKRSRDLKREEEGVSESLAGKFLTSRLQVYPSVWIV